MAGIDNGTQAGNRIVAIEARLQGAALRAAMHHRSLDGYQTEAPSRSRLIVSTRLVRPTPIRVGEVVSHRGNHKTIWHFHSADLDRRIKAAVWHGALLRLRSLARIKKAFGQRQNSTKARRDLLSLCKIDRCIRRHSHPATLSSICDHSGFTCSANGVHYTFVMHFAKKRLPLFPRFARLTDSRHQRNSNP